MKKISEILQNLKGKKIAIDDIVTSYSTKLTSHKSSHPYMICGQLKGLGLDVSVIGKDTNIYDYDVWLVVLPKEFAGTFNIFGGASDETALRIKRFIDFSGPIYVLNHEFPDIAGLVDSRMKTAKDVWKTLDSKAIKTKSDTIESIDVTLDSDTLIIGDSHSVSCWEPGANIKRVDGTILYSTLRDGIAKWLDGYGNINRLVSYFGNIDMRHHICRQSDPIEASKKLAREYMKQLSNLGIRDTNVVKLLPIEWEGRRVPGTGFYKKTPFYGSQKLRSQCVEAFNNILDELSKDSNISVISWPGEWYQMDPEEYADKCMEKPGSVHLSRENYRYNFETLQKNDLESRFKTSKKTEQKTLKINTLF